MNHSLMPTQCTLDMDEHPILRRVTAAVGEADRGHLTLDERRPWQPVPPLASLSFDYDVTGPEQAGLSRAERRQRLAEV